MTSIAWSEPRFDPSTIATTRTSAHGCWDWRRSRSHSTPSAFRPGPCGCHEGPTMNFAQPRWLWLLIAVPLRLLLEWRAGRRGEKRLAQMTGEGRKVLLEQRLPGQRRLGAVLRLTALVLLVVGASGPEWGYELVRRSGLGSEIVFTMDVSASMDVRDVPASRLGEAGREALAVLDQLGGSKVGVVAFAGDAARLCPLTLDRSAARLVIESLSSSSLSEPGTDLGRGLRTAMKLLPPKRRGEQAIVLWTDGEDLESQSRAAMDEIAAAGIRVFAIGVGTPMGDIVPVLDDQGRVVDVKRDEAGGPVRSRLDERLLKSLARRTRGGYFSAGRPGGELPRLLAALGPLGCGGVALRASTETGECARSARQPGDGASARREERAR